MTSGIFPNAVDGGLRPDSGQPNNPAQAYDPTIPPADTDALYFGNGCNVRLRPHVLNSLISEVASTCDRGEIPYRYSSLQNVETAVRYMIQRGIPRGGMMVGQPVNWQFTIDLEPAATRYNDYMTLTVIPTRVNDTFVRVNVNGLGYVPLLRSRSGMLGCGDELSGPVYNKKGELVYAGDLCPFRPVVMAFYQGAFYLIGWWPDPPVDEPCVGCPGVIDMWPTETAPWGSYECNGQSLSIAQDERLYEIIGTRYGSPGPGRFRVPDLRGEFVRGWDHGRGADLDAHARTNRGDGTTGDKVGTKQMDNTGAHTHPVNIPVISSDSTLWATVDPGGGVANQWGGFLPIPFSHPIYGVDMISAYNQLHGSSAAIAGASGGSSFEAKAVGFRGSALNITVSGNTGLNLGTDETRPRNVNLMYIIWR